MKTLALSLIALVLAAPAAPAESSKAPETEEEAKRLNRRRDVNEFGAHERPWAHDAIKVVEDEGALEELPGLAQASGRIKAGLLGERLAVPKALEIRAVEMAAAFDALAAEEARIEAAWAEIAEARAVAAVAQKRAAEEIGRLRSLKSEVEGLIGELERKEDANLSRMAELVSQMSAKRGAEILSSNDPETVLAILGRLDDRQSAEILGRMEDERGQALMVLMADQGRPEAGKTAVLR